VSLAPLLPDWVADPIRQQTLIHVYDSISTKIQKAESKEGGLPQESYFQSLPDHTTGPVTYAEQLGKRVRQEVNQQIATNMEAGTNRIRAHYGDLLTKGVNVWA
jgi:hypothetical protein